MIFSVIFYQTYSDFVFSTGGTPTPETQRSVNGREDRIPVPVDVSGDEKDLKSRRSYTVPLCTNRIVTPTLGPTRTLPSLTLLVQ